MEHLLQPPGTSSLLHPNIFLSSLTLGPSISVKNQVSHPYKTTCKIMVLYILIFEFSERRQEDKRV
jgi:hypothetical protein